MADALSAFDTFHNEDARMPYDGSTLAEPKTLAYDYVEPSLANHHFFDTPFYVEPNGFVGPSNNSFPYFSSSTEAGNQDSPYSPSETWSVTANSQETDESNNVFQGLP